VLIKSPIQNICDIVLHNTDAEGWVQLAEEDEFLSVTIDLFEKPPWTNGNAQRLGDKPPFKEGGMSVPRAVRAIWALGRPASWQSGG
jgi:hypothetical protein